MSRLSQEDNLHLSLFTSIHEIHRVLQIPKNIIVRWQKKLDRLEIISKYDPNITSVKT